MIAIRIDYRARAEDERPLSAVEAVQPALRKKGGTVELLGVGENIVRVKIEASGHGCGNSPEAVEQMVEQAILEAAPEVVEADIERRWCPAAHMPDKLH